MEALSLGWREPLIVAQSLGGCFLALTFLLCLLLLRNELNEHLDTIDSSLDNLQTMLTTHGFSVDTSALLDVSIHPPSPPSLSHVSWQHVPVPCTDRWTR